MNYYELDYYELIGVARTATQEEIFAACLRLGDKYRPDRNPNDDLAAKIFALGESAFATLGDSEKRAVYDTVLATSGKPEANRTVKVLDAGTKRLISGTEATAVEAALNDLLARGSRIVTPLSKLGNTWIAACTVPVKVHPADQTCTLSLTELAAPRDHYADEEAGECRIEKIGFMWIVRGPTNIDVQAKVKELVHLGAKLVSEIEVQEDGQWVASCDTAGRQNTGYRW